MNANKARSMSRAHTARQNVPGYHPQPQSKRAAATAAHRLTGAQSAVSAAFAALDGMAGRKDMQRALQALEAARASINKAKAEFQKVAEK